MSVRVAIVGVGNCASAFVQGLEFYRNKPWNHGMMQAIIGGISVDDIVPVVAFDIDERKVNKPLKEAIFALPNCCYRMVPEVSFDARVLLAPLFDGVATHMLEYPDVSKTFVPVAGAPDTSIVNTYADLLTEHKVDILINYLPVGSELATHFWATVCIAAKVGMMNCIPVFIASDPVWESRFKAAGVPVLGDDIKSQFGASILSQMLEELAIDRGHIVKQHIQQNSGGNTDFLNMTNKQRLASKKVSKESVITSQYAVRGMPPPAFVHAGPSDYVEVLQDTKVAHINMELQGFGGAPVSVDIKLKVCDSPNSAGVVIDAIRYLRTAQKLGLSGAIHGPSAFLCKHPPTPLTFENAKRECENLSCTRESSIMRL
jgi:myo-inositol-1-phosphate synthase